MQLEEGKEEMLGIVPSPHTEIEYQHKTSAVGPSGPCLRLRRASDSHCHHCFLTTKIGRKQLQNLHFTG